MPRPCNVVDVLCQQDVQSFISHAGGQAPRSLTTCRPNEAGLIGIVDEVWAQQVDVVANGPGRHCGEMALHAHAH
jgi:hypothetical protein